LAGAGADELSSQESGASEEAAAEPAKQGGRWWRGFTGSLAAGLTVLAVGVLVVAGVCLYTGAPGPGAVLLIGHPVAAVLALLAQRVTDRRNGAPAAGAGVAVVLFTVSALTLFWLT
jgi:predicted lipid-binding transport protein (Tim44 family)